MDYGTRYNPAVVVPGPRPGYNPASRRGRSAIKLTLSTATVTYAATQSGFIAARFALATIPATDFTIALGQRWNFAPLIPCVSWTLVGGSTRYRYRLDGLTTGVVPYEEYRGQLISTTTALIELWTPGNSAATVITPTTTVNLGIFTDDPNVTTTVTVAPCVTTVTPTSGFAAYMTSCS